MWGKGGGEEEREGGREWRREGDVHVGLGLQETDAEVELVCDGDFLVSRDYMTKLVELSIVDEDGELDVRAKGSSLKAKESWAICGKI